MHRLATLHTLYKYSVLPIYNDWLTLIDLCNLDTSLCNDEIRPNFLRDLVSLRFDGITKEHVSCSYISWISLRGISLGQLHLDRVACTIALEGSLFDHFLNKLSALTIHLSQLTLEGCHDWKDETLAEVISNANKLEKISFVNCPRIGDQTVQSALTSAALTHLTINHGINTQRPCWEIDISTSLLHLSLCECATLSDQALSNILSFCFQLIDLTVSSCPVVVRPTIANGSLSKVNLSLCKSLVGEAVTSMLISCASLQDLNLSGCIAIQHKSESATFSSALTRLDCTGTQLYLGPLQDDGVADEIKVGLVVDFPNLQYMKTSRMAMVTVSKQNYSLTEIDLSDSDARDENVVVAITLCVRLTTLVLSNCMDLLLEQALPPNNILRTLDISNCESISDDSIAAVCEACKQLTELNVSYCVELTDDALETIANSALRTTLLRFNMSGCNNDALTDNGVTMLLKHCIALTYLDISDCNTLEEPDLISASLRTLIADSCENLCEDAVGTLSVGCEQLTELHLSYSTDYEVSVLADNCTALRTMHIDNAAMTNEGVVKIGQCTALTDLKLLGCDEITVDALATLLTNSYDNSGALKRVEVSECALINKENTKDLRRLKAGVVDILIE